MELTELQKAFGDKLCQAMQEKNMTPYRLWQLTGISQAHIAAMMRGEQNACLDTIRKLCDALDKKPKFFFDYE